MVKKILLVAIVSGSGLMIGIFLSNFFPSNKRPDVSKANPPQQKSSSMPNINLEGLTVELTAQPTTIKSAGSLDAKTQLAQIDKSTLEISYSNKTPFDLTGVEIWVTTTSANSAGTATTTQDTKYDKDKSKNNLMVFDVSDLPKNSNEKLKIFYFFHESGEGQVHAEVKTKQGKSPKTKSVIVTVI